jgi:hypothetical protein
MTDEKGYAIAHSQVVAHNQDRFGKFAQDLIMAALRAGCVYNLNIHQCLDVMEEQIEYIRQTNDR